MLKVCVSITHFEVSHGQQGQQGERNKIEQCRLGGLEHLRADGGREEAEEVAQQGAVEVGQSGAGEALRFLVGVVTQHEAEQEARHHYVP